MMTLLTASEVLTSVLHTVVTLGFIFACMYALFMQRTSRRRISNVLTGMRHFNQQLMPIGGTIKGTTDVAGNAVELTLEPKMSFEMADGRITGEILLTVDRVQFMQYNMQLQDGGWLPPHRHADVNEIYIPIKGHAQLCLFDDDPEKPTIVRVLSTTSNLIGYARAGSLHTLRAIDGAATVIVVAVPPHEMSIPKR